MKCSSVMLRGWEGQCKVYSKCPAHNTKINVRYLIVDSDKPPSHLTDPPPPPHTHRHFEVLYL